MTTLEHCAVDTGVWKGVVNIPQNRKRESNNDNMQTDIAFFAFELTNKYIYAFIHSKG